MIIVSFEQQQFLDSLIVVLVKKKDGSLHLYVDNQNISKDTVPDRYSLPHVDETRC